MPLGRAGVATGEPVRNAVPPRGQRVPRWSVLDPTPVAGRRARATAESTKGTMILLHGTLSHWSAPNTLHRRAATPTRCIVIDGAAHYPDDNWLRRDASEMPLQGVPHDADRQVRHALPADDRGPHPRR